MSDASSLFIYTPGESSPVYVSSPCHTHAAHIVVGLSSEPRPRGHIQTISSMFATWEYNLFSLGANYRNNNSEKISIDESLSLKQMTLLFFDKTREWVLLFTALALLYFHNSIIVHQTIGGFACAAVAKVLKRIIRQERLSHDKQKKTSYGMPSTHSAAVMYLSTFLTFVMRNYATNNESSRLILVLAIIAVFILGICAALSRVVNGHHTLAQVVAGSLLGVSFASLWWLWRGAMLPIYDRCLQTVFA